ncbi:MAG: PHP domain-containing protein [Acidimicrobiales bacterium]
MIDLHCHSRCSDGSESPGRVVELASQAGLSALALTDHDGLDGVDEAGVRADALGLELVAGCEVSCRFSPGTMHLLCYFVEPGEGPLQSLLARLRVDRAERNERLVARLSSLGVSITMDEVVAEAGGGTIGRPHFAAVLARKGSVSSYEAAFETLLAKGGPAYVPKAFVEAPSAIGAARESGAVVSLAHPLSLGLGPDGLEGVVGELRQVGLEGLESNYGRYQPEERAGLAALANANGLVSTGGSDFHGSYKPDLFVGTGTGDLEVADSVLDELRARLGRHTGGRISHSQRPAR